MLTAQYDGILSQFSHWYYPPLHCAAFMMPSLLFRFSKFCQNIVFVFVVIQFYPPTTTTVSRVLSCRLTSVSGR